MSNDWPQILAVLQGTPPGGEAFLAQRTASGVTTESAPSKQTVTGFWSWLTSSNEAVNSQEATAATSPQYTGMGVTTNVGNASGASAAVSNQALLMSRQAFNILGASQKR